MFPAPGHSGKSVWSLKLLIFLVYELEGKLHELENSWINLVIFVMSGYSNFTEYAVVEKKISIVRKQLYLASKYLCNSLKENYQLKIWN